MGVNLFLIQEMSLVLSIFTFYLAAYISLTEEELGEDGLELDSSDSGSIPRVSNPIFHLEMSKDPDFVPPKNHLWLKWKWFTVFYQVGFIMQASTMIVYSYEYYNKEKLKNQVIDLAGDGVEDDK